MRFALVAASVAALVLQGCGSDGTAPPTGETAQLRLASTSPDAGPLDLLVNGRTVARGVRRTEVSAPSEVPAGRATGEVRATSGSAMLSSIPLTLQAGESYTVLAAGSLQALTVVVSADTGSGTPVPPPPVPQPVDSGNPPQPPPTGGGNPPQPPPVDSGHPTQPPPPVDVVRFRIVHAAPDAPPLDPYLTPSGAPLDTLPVIQPFEYGSLALTADLVRRAGHYAVEFTMAGTRQVLLRSEDIDAKAGELVTAVLAENADRSLRVDVVRE